MGNKFMNKEMSVPLNGRGYRVFLQDGFLLSCPPAGVFHKHAHTEIHVICKGCVRFALTDRTICIEGPKMILIPGDTYHAVTAESGAMSSAFQINYAVPQLGTAELNEGVAHAFAEEVDRGTRSNDDSRIQAYITLLCQLCLPLPAVTAAPIGDSQFLIHEFFTQNYAAEVHLSDLAQILNLSQRQTERLVVQYTGNSFARELAAKRVTMARFLQSTTAMTMSEIARYVGYRSYSGFWKAVKKYGL